MEASAAPMTSSTTKAAALIGLLVSGLCYFFIYGSSPAKTFAGSEIIFWQAEADCGGAPAKSCASKPFIAKGSSAVLRYKSGAGTVLSASIGRPGAADKLAAINLPPGPADWGEVVFDVPLGEEVLIRIKAQGGEYFAVHRRLAFYKPSPAPFVGLEAGPPTAALSLLFAAALVLVLVRQFNFSAASWLLIAAACTLLAQLRLPAFFQWDEWDAIIRIMNEGPSASFALHNQHFIPLFFSAIYLQLLLFKDSYLLGVLVNHALHAVNAVLFMHFIARLQNSSRITPSAALCGMLFLISLLHGEVLGWWFGLCTIMFFSAVLAAALCSWEYLKRGRLLSLVGTAIFAAAAPLSFGNGFSVLIYLPAFLGAALLLGDKTAGQWKRFVLLLTCALIAVLLVAAVYARLQAQAENIVHAPPLALLLNEGLGRLVGYIAVGSQAGTVLRGLWILPGYAPGQVYQSFPEAFSGYLSPICYISLFGLLVTMLISALGLVFGADWKRTAVCWVLGQVLLISPFILVGFGRWQEETAYALFLRYSYSSLPGLIVIALPMLEQTMRRKFVVGWFLVLGYFAAQLYHGPGYTHVSGYGEAAADWAARIRESAALASEEGSEFEELLKNQNHPLAPLPPEHLPALHSDPQTIYNVLRFVNPQRYPK